MYMVLWNCIPPNVNLIPSIIVIQVHLGLPHSLHARTSILCIGCAVVVTQGNCLPCSFKFFTWVFNILDKELLNIQQTQNFVLFSQTGLIIMFTSNSYVKHQILHAIRDADAILRVKNPNSKKKSSLDLEMANIFLTCRLYDTLKYLIAKIILLLFMVINMFLTLCTNHCNFTFMTRSKTWIALCITVIQDNNLCFTWTDFILQIVQKKLEEQLYHYKATK